MNKILKDSLIRKNKHVYTNALKAIENVMGEDFTNTNKFRKIRSIILTVGNEVSRSIDTELDQYACVMREGVAPVAICAGEYIKSLLPNIKFERKAFAGGEFQPTMTIVAKNADDDLSLLREILGCGIVFREKGLSVCQTCGVRDCMKVIPILNQFMFKLSSNGSYVKWVEDVQKSYRLTTV